MKILHLTELFAPVGGAEQYLLNLLPLLEGAGHENVVVYWEHHPRTAPDDNRTVHYVPVEEPPARQQHIRAIIGQEQPALIYLHSTDRPALIAAIAPLAPTVAYVHDFDPLCPGLAKYYRRGKRICTRPYGLGCAAMIYLRRCASARHPISVYRIMQNTRQHLAIHQELSGLLVASNYMRELLIQNGLAAGRITVLPHFTQLPDAAQLVAPAGDCPRLLFVGRLEEEKGLPYLLHALACISRPYRLLVAGDGSRRAAYEALAQELGVAGQVDFLGWQSQAELAQAYQRATCLVFPSVWPEPFGMVGIDAFGYGRPVVAFNVGGVSDWLRDGWNGYLAPPQDVDQLAGRIEALLAQPALAREMGANGRRTAEECYTPGQHLEKLLAVFTDVLEHVPMNNLC
ncbi:MAG: glycosyltransferase family 4 protein [Chloroflexi bacterium]|nr:glycosyltransferase family 4 protein [Chloroflexota bacterium]